MSKNRVIYPNLGLFAGPSPATGYNFISLDSGINNNWSSGNNYNLLQQIDRVTEVSYGINIDRNELKQLGTLSLVARPIIRPPTIDLSFNYYINGIKNEARLGFDVNYGQWHSGHSGDAFFDNRVCPISGMYNRDLERISGRNPFWLYTYKDTRNFHVAVAPEGTELRESYISGLSGKLVTYRSFDPLSDTYQVYSFGNCYLQSYRTNAALFSIPQASVSYICENMNFALSGTGITTPAVNVKTNEVIDKNIKFCIPRTIFEGSPSVILPGNITISFTNYNYTENTFFIDNSGKYFIDNIDQFFILNNSSIVSGNDFPDLGIDIRDMKLTSYSLDINLPRQPLESLGYKKALDRPINFPVFANLNFDGIVGDLNSGSFLDLINRDSNYNITLKLKNPDHGPFPYTTGWPAVQYDLINAKLNSISSRDTIGQNKTANFSFSVELDPSNTSKGLFISGLTNIQNINNLMFF